MNTRQLLLALILVAAIGVAVGVATGTGTIEDVQSPPTPEPMGAVEDLDLHGGGESTLLGLSTEETDGGTLATGDDDDDGSVDDTTGELDDAVNEEDDDSADGATEDDDDAADDTTDDTTDTIDDTTDETTDSVDDTTDETADSVDETTDDSTDTVDDTTDETTDTIDDTTNETTDTVDQTTDDTEDSIVETTNATTDTTDETTDGTADTVEESGNETNMAADPTNVTTDIEDGDTDETPSTIENSTTDFVDGTAVDRGSNGVDDASIDDSEPDDESTADDVTDDSVVTPSDVPTSEGSTVAIGAIVAAVGLAAVRTGQFAGVSAGASPASTWLQIRSAWTFVREAVDWPRYLPAFYNRFDDTDPLENETRRRLYEEIELEPGISLAELDERTDCSRSTIRYHVRVLSRETMLESALVFGNRRLVATEGEPATDDSPSSTLTARAAVRDETLRDVLEAIADTEDATGVRLADRLDRDPSTVAHHLERLENAELVDRDSEGRTVVNRLTPGAWNALAVDEDHSSVDGSDGDDHD